MSPLIAYPHFVGPIQLRRDCDRSRRSRLVFSFGPAKTRSSFLRPSQIRIAIREGRKSGEVRENHSYPRQRMFKTNYHSYAFQSASQQLDEQDNRLQCVSNCEERLRQFKQIRDRFLGKGTTPTFHASKWFRRYKYTTLSRKEAWNWRPEFQEPSLKSFWNEMKRGKRSANWKENSFFRQSPNRRELASLRTVRNHRHRYLYNIR